MRGLALSDSPGRKGVAAIIPKGSPLEGMVTDVAADPGGRWSLIRIDAKTQFYHILNVYAPNKERSRPAFFRRMLGMCTAYANLICVGDWNYVDSPEDKVSLKGKIPKVVRTAGVREAQVTLDCLDMIDLYRFYYPDDQSTTFRHRKKDMWARLDR